MTQDTQDTTPIKWNVPTHTSGYYNLKIYNARSQHTSYYGQCDHKMVIRLVGKYIIGCDITRARSQHTIQYGQLTITIENTHKRKQ